MLHSIFWSITVGLSAPAALATTAAVGTTTEGGVVEEASSAGRGEDG